MCVGIASFFIQRKHRWFQPLPSPFSTRSENPASFSRKTGQRRHPHGAHDCFLMNLTLLHGSSRIVGNSREFLFQDSFLVSSTLVLAWLPEATWAGSSPFSTYRKLPGKSYLTTLPLSLLIYKTEIIVSPP